jgi:uncharacterized membrane protein
VNNVIWGIMSALSLGTADFAARFSSRSIGHTRALLGMLTVSGLLVTIYSLGADASILRFGSVTWLIVLYGVLFTAAMLALYAALAIGPIKIAAPLVASHPVIVVLWALANGAQLTLLQAIGLAVTIIGVIIIGYPGRDSDAAERRGIAEHQRVIGVAALASLLYAVMLIAGQAAARDSGALATLCLGRLVALAVLVPFAAIRPGRLRLPFQWWPVLIAQGVLDSGGVLFLLFGSFGPNREITVVISAAFGAVTVLLAWVFLKERLSALQWMAAAMIFAGTACLATAG